jgi:hypothetical protein
MFDTLLKDPNMPVYIVMAVLAVVLFWDKIKPKAQATTSTLAEITRATMATMPTAQPVEADKDIDWREAACYCRCLQAYLKDDAPASQALKEVVWPAIGSKP